MNVHPSKTSVLIQGEDEVLGLLQEAVRAALQNVSLPTVEMPQAQAHSFVQEPEEQKASARLEAKEYTYTPPKWTPPAREARQPPSATWDRPALLVRESALPAYTPPAEEFLPRPEEETEEQQTFAAVDDLIDYTMVGQLFGTYVLVQSGDAAYIIDQHAAHERLNYERLKGRETLLPQKLLVPYALKLSQADHDLLLKNADFLSTLGFGIEDFGAGTIKITSLPLRQEQGDIQSLMEDVLDMLQGAGREALPFRDKIVRRACRSSIKAGEHLSAEEMRELIREMRESKTIPVCPHGRPVAVVLAREELEKSFKRRV